MNCAEARERIGANPDDASPELLAHLETCPECQTYRQEMLVLNAKIRRALEFDWSRMQGGAAQGAAPTSAATPTTAADRSNVTVLARRSPRSVPKHKRPRLLAFAASVAVALVAALTLWLSRPPESLAAEVVKHVEGEPNSWYKTQPVTSDHLEAVLRKSGVKLGQGMPSVVYASSCWFRGHFVPHFVVTTQDGPVTVMILQNEKVRHAQQFNEGGFSGLLVPAPTGSVAVVTRTPMALEQSASSVVRALQSAQGGN